MSNIKARVGSQNVVRVLSNASAPPTKLTNLTDVETSDKSDSNILVWDSTTELFVLTNDIRRNFLFTDTTQSISPSSGALIISGGVGIGKNLNIQESLRVVGHSTFTSVDIDNLYVTGITTLSGVTTTFSDFYVGNNAYVANNFKVNGTSEFIGIVTFRGGTISIGDSDSDDINISGEFISNLVPNVDNTYDLGLDNKRWRNARFSGLTTTRLLNVSGVSTFYDDIQVYGFASITEGIYYDDEYDGPNGIAYFDNSGKLIGASSTESPLSETYFMLTTNSLGLPKWSTTIDGGEY